MSKETTERDGKAGSTEQLLLHWLESHLSPVDRIPVRSDICARWTPPCGFTWTLLISHLRVHTWSFAFSLLACPLPASLSFSSSFILHLYRRTKAKDLLVGVRTATPPTGLTAPPSLHTGGSTGSLSHCVLAVAGEELRSFPLSLTKPHLLNTFPITGKFQ